MLEGLIFILATMCALHRDFAASLSGSLVGILLVLILGAIQLVDARALGEPSSLLPFTLSRPQTLHALLIWGAFASLLWAASGVMRWEGAVRRASWAIFGVGLFIAVVGIIQRGQGNAAYYALRPVRHGLPFGPFVNRDHAASWLAASILVGLGLFAEGFRRGRAPLADRIPKQGLMAFALAVQFVAVVQTASRGAINALFVAACVTSFLVTCSLSKSLPRRVGLTGLFLAGCGYLVLLRFNTNWLGLADGAFDNSTAYRLSMYRSGLRMLFDFPIFGVGLGGFEGAFQSYQEPLVVGLVEHIHSSWLEIAVEIGVLGFVIFSVAIFKSLADLGRRLVNELHSPGALSAGFFAALLAVLLHGVVEFTFQIPGIAVLTVVLVAVVEATRMDSFPDSGSFH